MSVDPGPCINEDCSFNSNGVCVEDQDPPTCRFRSGRPLISPDAIADLEDAQAPEAEVDGLALAHGRRLEAAECGKLREQTLTRVVSILAPKNAGKTSLIAGFYELFLEGRAEGAIFAASDTLLDFERICHLSRAESGRVIPDMERTKRAAGLGYYHLLLKVDGRRLGLLLGDRPGETVAAAVSGAAGASPMVEIRSADCILYLMDGEQLVSPETRSLPLSQAEAVLDGVMAASHLDHTPALGIVLTKSDLVAEAEQLGRFESAVGALTRRFGSRFKVHSFVTAANPVKPDSAVARGHGMNKLLAFLLTCQRPPAIQSRVSPLPQRHFGRLGRIVEIDG